MADAIDVVIDTDIGSDPDDAIAIALAVASPELNVRGLTIVSGDSDWRAGLANRVLGMLGRGDIPVIAGNVAGWLIDQSSRRPYHLIAIGPLTNVAGAIIRDPEFASRLSGMSVMGGVFDPENLPDPIRRDIEERGIAAAWPDYNTMTDPPAALAVAESGAAVRWTTIDATFTVPLSRAALGMLPETAEFTGALREMIGSWDAYREESGTSIHGQSVPTGYTDTFLHDPLTVASLWHGDWLTMAPIALDYAIDDEVFRMYPDKGDRRRNASVSTMVDGDTFATICMRRIADHLKARRR